MMCFNLLLEKASLHHLAELETLAYSTFTATFGHLYTPENLQSHLVKTCSAAFFADALANGCNIDIARCGDEVVGYIKYGAVGLPIAYTKDDVEIHRLYVSAKWQGQGIGKKLMDHALQSLAVQSAAHLYLGVWEHNHKAQAFYRRYAFRPIGKYLYYVGTHADREIIMQRVI